MASLQKESIVAQWYGIQVGISSRMWLTASLVTLLSGYVTTSTAAQTDSGNYRIRNFQFVDGKNMTELRIHYMTLGRKDHPAVLILHGTGGSYRQFLAPIFAAELFGAGQALDTTRYFIILADGIGHGGSSKPSDGLRAQFPHYDYDDMVRAQYRLVSEGLGLQKLRLVLGTSMGCMHAWVWAETYPTFMDGIVPLACLPTQIAGRNRMWRKLAIDAVRADPGWKDGNYAAEPTSLATVQALVLMVSGSPSYYQRLGPTRDSADIYLGQFRKRMHQGGFADANDAIYALDASRDYDPTSGLEQIRTRVLAINFADDQVNPPELGIMEKLIRRVKGARFILIPADQRTVGHGTHTKAAVWKSYLDDFMKELTR
jgi:homoserine O-acetyltransferase